MYGIVILAVILALGVVFGIFAGLGRRVSERTGGNIGASHLEDMGIESDRKEEDL